MIRPSLSRSGLIKMVCTINNSSHATLLTTVPDALLVSETAARLNEILPTKRRSVDLSPSLSLRDLYCKLCLILVPLIHRPKVLATRATNEPHPIARLQLFEATDGSMIVELHDVWELGALARHDALERPNAWTYTRPAKRREPRSGTATAIRRCVQ
jgi:hypothetical protein